MIVYLVTLVISCCLAYQAERTGWRDERSELHFNKRYVALLIIFLCVVSGFRYMNYYQSDEYNYRQMVDAMKGVPFKINFGFEEEWISQMLYWISANIFKSNQFFILIAAVITNVSLVIFFSRHVKSLTLVIFLYIAGGAYFTSMNIIRQYIAVAIIVWGYDLAKKKKMILYFLLVIFAAGIHQSAWLMLPMYFVLRKKRLDWSAAFIIVAVLFVFMNFQTIMSSMLIEGSTYDHYLADILSGGYGVKLIRILVWLVPYFLLIIKFRYCEKNIRMDTTILFATLISVCVSIVSYKYVFFARIDVYFSVPALCGVAYVPELFEEKSRRIVLMAMVILFFAFGCYQMRMFSPYHNILFEEISGVL